MCAPECAAPDDSSMTCEECTAGIQGAIDQLLATETIDAIVAAMADPDGPICGENPNKEDCTEGVDFIIRNGLPLLASVSDGSQFPTVCNAAVEGTCAARRFAKLF